MLGTSKRSDVSPVKSRPSSLGLHLYTAHLAAIWGLALSNICLGLVIIWCWRNCRDLRLCRGTIAPMMLPLMTYSALLSASVLSSIDPGSSLSGLKEMISLTTLVLGIILVRGSENVRRVLTVLARALVFVSIYGILQHYIGGYGGLHKRIIGPFSHYQTYAGVLLLGDAFLFSRLLTGKSWASPWLWLSMLAVNWALMLTLTRGAWVAAASTLCIGALIYKRRSSIFAPVCLGLFASVILLFGPELWKERINSIFDPGDPSNYDRICMAEAGLHMISERPLLGIGPDMVALRYPIYRHPTAPRFEVPHLHSTFLQIAAERGIVSLLSYAWIFGSSLVTASRAYVREGRLSGKNADLFIASTLSILAFNLAGLFENNWGDTEVQRLMLFVLAIPFCLERRNFVLPDEPAPQAAVTITEIHREPQEDRDSACINNYSRRG